MNINLKYICLIFLFSHILTITWVYINMNNQKEKNTTKVHDSIVKLSLFTNPLESRSTVKSLFIMDLDQIVKKKKFKNTFLQ